MSGWNEISGIICKLVTPPAKALWVMLAGVVSTYWLGCPEGMRTAALAVMALFVLDTITGSWLALRDKQFSSKCFGRSISKFIVYALALLVTIPLGTLLRLDYTITLAAVYIIGVREGSSCIENIDVLCPGLIPKWVSDRLHKLQDACSSDPEALCAPQTQEDEHVEPAE